MAMAMMGLDNLEEQIPAWKHNEKFDGLEEDELRYEEMMKPMEEDNQEYNEFEDGLLTDALEDLHLQTDDEKFWKTVNADESFPRLMAKNSTSSERVKRVKGTAIIPTSPEKMLAWTFAFNSNYDMSLHFEANGKGEWVVSECVSE